MSIVLQFFVLTGGEYLMAKKAVVLFSGGLDSTTCVMLAAEQQFAVYALSIDYGQKHIVELQHAKDLAKKLPIIEHKTIHIALNELGGSALTDQSIAVKDFNENGKIPATYVPARNTIFLSIALGWAEILGARDIFVGANAVDYSGYPDCRPDYLRTFEELANLATIAGTAGNHFTIHAPLLRLHKHQIIAEGIRLGIDYSQTLSCYRADQEGKACGNCDSCFYRKKGFKEAGVADPTKYYR